MSAFQPNARRSSLRSSGSANLFSPEFEAAPTSESQTSADVADSLGLPGSRSRLKDTISASSDAESESVRSISPEAIGLASPPCGKNGSQKPSPWWILIMTTFSATVLSMTMAPKTEVYIRLVCAQYRPEFLQPPVLPVPREGHWALPLPLNPPTTLSYLPRPDESLIPVKAADPLITFDKGFRVHVPRPSSKCTSDPEVGQIVAGLNTAVTLTLGILSLITTGYWTSYSDRVGRKHVLGISTLAGLLADTVFIVTTLGAGKITWGYNLFILCSVMYGLAGGSVTHIAAAQSYCSDCADPTSRGHLLSMFYGMMFTGFAVGPTIGGLLTTATNDMLSIFYVAIVGHIISASLIWFVLPESLSPEIRAANSSSHAAAKLAINEAHLASTGLNAIVTGCLSRLFSFLIPLRTFLPRERDIQEPGYANGGRDWNLTLLGLSSGVSFTVLGMIPIKFQYAEATFDWNSETLGYYMTAMGAARAIHLAVLLPLIIRVFGPKADQPPSSHITRDQNDPGQPLLGEHQLTNARSQRRYVSPTSHSERIARHHGHRSARFNLTIARVSLLVDLAAYTLVSLSATGPQFLTSSMMSSFGTGFSPSTQALALHLIPSGDKDAGKLFGAFGMLGALSTQVIGPSLFGFIYIATVAVFPKAIFVVGAAVLLCAFTTLSLVRLPRHTI